MSISNINGSKYYEQISSGYRINSAADDASGLAISEKLQSQVTEYKVSNQNASAGQGLINVADGALSNINDVLQRIRELGVQAGNASIYGKEGLSVIQDEIDQLKDSIQDIAKNTEYNTRKLLDGSNTEWHIASGGSGRDISIPSATLEALGIADFDVTSGDFDLRTIDEAISKVSSARSGLGANSNGLTHQINYNSNTGYNLEWAQSNKKDVDMAEAISEMKKSQLLDEYKLYMTKKQIETNTNNQRRLFQGML